MINTVDPQFIIRTNNLIQEILSDEARFSYPRNDLSFQILHNKIFSKADQTPFKDFQESEKLFFNKYFYVGGAVGIPRFDVPFTDSKEDQAFFFDHFRHQVKNITYNYESMGLLQPTFPDEKALAPIFNDSQKLLISQGLVQTCLFALEQRKIAQIEKKSSTPGTIPEVEATANPFATLGEKTLIKGLSGEFDQVLSFTQLEQIALEEATLHSKGLAQDEINNKLREYIAKTFPGLNIALDEQGKVQTFQSTTLSFSEMVKEMKLRQGRKVQYDAIIASNGNLAFTTETFQTKYANGTSSLDGGLTIRIDQGGKPNSSVAVFYLRDKQGVSARFSVDIVDLRLNGKTPLDISIYQVPAEDSPTSPKLKISTAELEKLKKALLVLYKQAQTPETYDPAADKPKLLKPFSTPTKTPTSTGKFALGADPTTLVKPEIVESPSLMTMPAKPLSVGFKLPDKLGKLTALGADPKSAAGLTYRTTRTIVPKIPAYKKPLDPVKKPVPPSVIPPGKPGEYSAKNTKTIDDEETPANPPTPSPKISAPVKALIVTGIPIATAVITALAGASLG